MNNYEKVSLIFDLIRPALCLVFIIGLILMVAGIVAGATHVLGIGTILAVAGLPFVLMRGGNDNG